MPFLPKSQLALRLIVGRYHAAAQVRGILVAFMLAQFCSAETVITSCGEAALREAITRGGLIILACDGTIQVSQSFIITNDVTIDARGQRLTLDGQGSVGLFQIQPNSRLKLLGLTLTRGGGADGGAIFNQGGRVEISQCLFTNNLATGSADSLFAGPSGGAIFSRGGEVIISDSHFATNGTFPRVVLQVSGGALRMLGGRLTISDSVFERNHCQLNQYEGSVPTFPPKSFGGALALTDVEARLNGCVFRQNKADSLGARPFVSVIGSEAEGGAIFHEGGATLKLSSCEFLENQCSGGPGFRGFISGDGRGGAIFASGPVTISASIFDSNTGRGGGGGSFQGANGSGGALHFTSPATVDSSAFFSNLAFAGPSCLCGNSPKYGNAWGGAIFNGGSIRLIACSFVSNRVEGPPFFVGGGISWPSPGQNLGGAIYSSGDVVTTNSTWFANRVVAQLSCGGGEGLADGAAIYQTSGNLSITHSTFASNEVITSTSVPRGGITLAGIAAGQMFGTIQAGRGTINLIGSAVDLGFNLSSDATPSFTTATSRNAIDPRLGSSRYEESRFVIPLRPDSPAIDAIPPEIRPAETDQRGVPRPFGLGSDIGAYEFVGPFVFIFRLNPLTSYQVETSTDLIHWMSESGGVSNERGELVFTNADPFLPQRFYRAVQTAPGP